MYRAEVTNRADKQWMLALAIRQPYAELVLRGIKTAELRSRSTSIVGERFYIYACKSKAKRPQQIWSDDLRLATPPPPLWMIELAEQVGMIPPGELAALPRGVIVGSAVVVCCQLLVVSGSGSRSGSSLTTNNQQPTTLFKWHLSDVRRLPRQRKPSRHPQPAWFTPF